MVFYLTSSHSGTSHQLMQGPALELGKHQENPTVIPAACLYLSNGKNEQDVLLYYL